MVCVSRIITLKVHSQVDVVITLNNPSVVGHKKFLQPMLILSMKFNASHIDCISRRLMHVIILYYATFVLQLIFSVLVGSIHKGLGEDVGSCEFTIKLVWSMLIIPTQIFTYTNRSILCSCCCNP